MRLLAVAWKPLLFFTCCVVRMRKEGVDEVSAEIVKNFGKPQLIILNHMSFFDILAAVMVFPCAVGARVRVMASEHVFRTPIVGTLAGGAGHLSVPFKDQSTQKVEGQIGSVANFAVDKEAVANIQEQFEAWVKAGNVGGWFPEGRMNPNPDVLQQFRAGGFQLALHLDCAIYCTVYAGFDVFWNRKAGIGGEPSNVSVKAFTLCKSSFELIQQLTQGKGDLTDHDKSILLANHAQARMQEEYDRVLSDGWVSRPKKASQLHVELKGVKDVETGS